MSRLFSLFLAATTIGLAGCAGIDSKQAAALNQTVASTSQTLGTTLSNTQTVDTGAQMLKLAVNGPNDVDPGAIKAQYLSDTTRNALISQFNALVQYSANLAKVTGAQTSFATNVGTLDSALNQASTDANALTKQVSGIQLLTTSQASTVQKDLGTVSQAFAAIGQGLLNLYADHQAYKIATESNPAIQQYCSLLQHALGANSTPDNANGLYGLVYNAYGVRINDLDNLYSETPPLPKPTDLGSSATDAEKEAYRQSKYLLATRAQQRIGLIQQIYQLQQQRTQDINTVLSLAKAVGQIAQAHQALVDKKKETFIQEISAAITTLQNLAGYYKTGGGGSSTPSSATSPSATTTTPPATTTSK